MCVCVFLHYPLVETKLFDEEKEKEEIGIEKLVIQIIKELNNQETKQQKYFN